MSWQLLSHSGTSSDTLLLHCSPIGHAAEEERRREKGVKLKINRCHGGEEKIEGVWCDGEVKMKKWREFNHDLLRMGEYEETKGGLDREQNFFFNVIFLF